MDILNLEHETATSILARFNLVPPTSHQTDSISDQNASLQQKQMKLSTPVMTRKKNGSFLQTDEHTLNLTQELSSISSNLDSAVNSSRVKSPKQVNSLTITEPLSVSSTVNEKRKMPYAPPIVKLDKASSCLLYTSRCV